MPHTEPTDQHHKLMTLVEALKATMPGLPGFQALSCFGSIAEGRADAYSDIDLIVTTNDLPSAKAHLLDTLEQVGPVEFCWTINLRPCEWNCTVVFREESYYHKLDLGLLDTSAVKQAVLQCDRARPATQSKAYIPDHGSLGHFLLGQFLGCTRYLKARRRGQTMTCYRFASAAVGWRLALLYAHLTETPHFRSRLSTAQYLEMDNLLSADECRLLLSEVGFSDLPTMDKTLRTAMNGMLEDGKRLAAMVGEVLPGEVFDRALQFLDEELEDIQSD